MTNFYLAACPFCGATEGIVRLISDTEINMENDISIGNEWTVCCDQTMGGCGSSSGYDTSQEHTVAAWNRRQPSVLNS